MTERSDAAREPINPALAITKVTKPIGFAAMSPERRFAAQSAGGRNVAPELRGWSRDHAAASTAGTVGGKAKGKGPFCDPDVARAAQRVSTAQRLLLRSYGETILATGSMTFTVDTLMLERDGRRVKVKLLLPLTITGSKASDGPIPRASPFVLAIGCHGVTGQSVAKAMALLAQWISISLAGCAAPDEWRAYIPARWFREPVDHAEDNIESY